MTRKSSHPPTAPPPVPAVVVILAKRLMITEKSATLSAASDKRGSLQEAIPQHFPRLAKIRRIFEGYSHHGINE